MAWPVLAQECDPAQDLACITQINITLDEDCQFELTPAILLSGDAACINATSFEIEVADNLPENGALVDGCGSFQYNISEVLAPGDEGSALNCWGTLTAYDAVSPLLLGLPQVGATLLCDQLSAVNINELPGSVSRCWQVDGPTGQLIPATLNPQLRMRLEAAGGLPDFRDACGRIEICVTDQVTNSDGCSDLSILRRFTARDGIDCAQPPGQPNEPTIAFQPITLRRPDISDVEGADASVLYECDGDFPLLPPNQFGVRNPAPRPSDYPFFLNDGERVFLNAPFCNIGTNFEDGPRQETCPETYRFLRTYTVVDWCQPENIETFGQLVKVGDFETPDISPPTQDLNFDGEPDSGPLFFSTSQDDCSSTFLLPAATLTDNCSESSSYVAFILPFGDASEVPFGPFEENDPIIDIPLGEHIIRYIAVDGCDNADTLDVPLSIGDMNPPLAICEDGLDISLNGFGQAIILPSAIDANSRDDCSDQLILEIARVDEGEQPLGGWLEQVTLTCEDLGDQSLALRVTDESGNQNACWLNVLVEDKLAPICQPPPSQTLTCTDPILADLPEDLSTAFDEDPITTAALLNAAFGQGSGIDNCTLDTVTQTVIDTRNSCGIGIVVRNFVAVDGEGLSSGNIVCQQVVTITAQHDYSLRFPADAESEECIEPDFSELEFDVNACDLITSTTRLDTFVASSDECYKLRVTYEVINWCEYSTEADPYVVPRDANDNDILEEPTDRKSVV